MSKRIFSIILASFAGLQAFAQLNPDYVDNALLFSTREYDGTARAVGMGNAMGALGGDLGAITYNPAASAIYRYSEITLTPSLYSGNSRTSMLESTGAASKTRLSLSNMGWVTSYESGLGWLRNFNFAITVNQVNNLAYSASVEGRQSNSSYLGYLAASMPGIDASIIDFDNPNLTWPQVMAWETGMIDTLSGARTTYIGATENIFNGNTFGVPGTLRQSYTKDRTGYVEDVTFNVGGNISDILFFGINMTFQSVSSSELTSISEVAENPDLFDTGFTDFTRTNRVNTSGLGFNMAAGIIVRPVAGLTLGASITTPTWIAMEEHYEEFMTGYTDMLGGWNSYSPYGNYHYRLTTPFRWNISAGYTFGGRVAIDVDYERADYSRIRLAGDDGNRYVFQSQNEYISSRYRATNNFRMGIEAWVHKNLALRAGYNYYESPEAYALGNDRHYISGGIGYRAASGFFIDAAYQQMCNSNSLSFVLYPMYENNESPIVTERYSFWKFLLTLGWRF